MLDNRPMSRHAAQVADYFPSSKLDQIDPYLALPCTHVVIAEPLP